MASTLTAENCRIYNIDSHYTQQNAAKHTNHSAAPQVQRFEGVRDGQKAKLAPSYTFGQCSGGGQDLYAALRKQRQCNAGLIQAALKHLQGRQLVMIGDSIMLQQWLSVLVMMPSFVKGFACPHLSSLYLVGYANCPQFQCAETPGWQRGARGVRFCYAHRNPYFHNMAKALRLLGKNWEDDDVIVMNSGLHHGSDLAITNKTVSDVLEFAAERQGRVPQLFWRETSPQHFAAPYARHTCRDPPACSQRDSDAAACGAAGTADSSKPAISTKCETTQLEQCAPCSESLGWKGCINGMEHNGVANALLESSAVRVVHIWEDSVADWTSHLGLISNRENITRLDCSHYCLPSPTVTGWTLALFAELTGLRASRSGTDCSVAMSEYPK